MDAILGSLEHAAAGVGKAPLPRFFMMQSGARLKGGFRVIVRWHRGGALRQSVPVCFKKSA